MAKPPMNQSDVVQMVKDWIAGLDRRMIIQVAVIAMLFVVFFFGLFLPILVQNQQSGSKVKDLKIKIQGGNARVAQIPSMQKLKEGYETAVKTGREKFFDSKEADQIINVISAAAASNNVKITSSSPSKETMEFQPPFNQMYNSVGYDLTVEGPYHQIGIFLNNLEHYHKNFLIFKCHVMKNEAEPSIRKCSIVVAAFLQKGKIQ